DNRGETGAWFLYLNTSKKSLALDLKSQTGREVLLQLVKTADILVENFAPGVMERLGLGYAQLQAVNPALVMVSISNYGQTGPYRDWKATELNLYAAGGLMNITGEPESEPLKEGAPLAQLGAGQTAFVATMGALMHAEDTGQGQHIDLSVQEAVTNLLFKAPLAWELNGIVDGRWPSPSAGGARRTGIWPCEDGYVSWVWWVARGWGRKNVPLLQWMAEESDVDDLLAVDWEALSITTVPKDLARRFESAAGEFFLRHTKAELYEQAVQRRFILYPVNSPRDVLADSQLEARDYWQSIVDPDSGTVLTHPGAWFKGAEYLPRARGPAPRLGEHNRYVFQGMLGLSNQELVTLKATGAM
ncbi:MAG: CoA transferase, partial [Chloroflexi bacterium]|nr:CoA transferase [Chloroflexota bacterium]